MAKIAVFLTDLFQDIEYIEPARAFSAAGHELTHVGLVAGETVRGLKRGIPVRIEKGVKEVSADHFDALLIPRGQTLDHLRKNRQAETC
jgi:protease I